MKLEALLFQKSSSIIARWIDLLLETYPADAQRFLKKQKDRFANPVGTTLSRELEILYHELLKGMHTDKLSPILDRIIRIRAVQDFSPGQAIAFIFILKRVIRSEMEKDLGEEGLAEELLAFESRIDALALLAFDIYMKCREKIYEIRVNETRNHVSRLLQKAGLICEVPGAGAGAEPNEG
jgi:hypothetical protein